MTNSLIGMLEEAVLFSQDLLLGIINESEMQQQKLRDQEPFTNYFEMLTILLNKNYENIKMENFKKIRKIYEITNKLKKTLGQTEYQLNDCIQQYSDLLSINKTDVHTKSTKSGAMKWRKSSQTLKLKVDLDVFLMLIEDYCDGKLRYSEHLEQLIGLNIEYCYFMQCI